MAERRMFSKAIIDSDDFLTMPLTTQVLYFHLGMRGDDEGFVNKPRSIMRTIGSSDDDIKLLIQKKFIIPFESGIIVITHWKIHNYIRGDRVKDTVFQDEKALLTEKENGAYALKSIGLPCQSDDSQLTGKRQDRLDQVRLGKDNIYTPEFEKFWNIYPRTKRMSKKDSFKAWNARLKEKYTPEMILEGARGYAIEMKGKEEKFIKQPETFLGPGIHFECYLDTNENKKDNQNTIDLARLRAQQIREEFRK